MKVSEKYVWCQEWLNLVKSLWSSLLDATITGPLFNKNGLHESLFKPLPSDWKQFIFAGWLSLCYHNCPSIPHHFTGSSFIWSNNIQEIMYHHVLQLGVCRTEYISWQRYTWPNSTFLLIRSIWKCTSHSSMEGCAFSDGGNINISFPSLISDRRTDSAWGV